ncbi:MAG TPA: tetratricopeptide repeat protein [Sphingomicrobium sp.]|nr:tetratricopeptide repeat protein [Sphingomicrobium sp.]
MKLILLAASVAAVSPLAASEAAVLTLGGPLSELCYQAAAGADGRSSAIESCTRALVEESLSARDKASTYVNRGIVLMNAGRFDEANADFDTAVRLQQKLPDAWLNKGFLKLREGDGRDALVLIQKAIEEGAGDRALALFGRGVAHEQMGDVKAAYLDLMHAHQLAPHWVLPRDYLARYRVAQR